MLIFSGQACAELVDLFNKDIMNSVQPDPITGKIGVDALMKWVYFILPHLDARSDPCAHVQVHHGKQKPSPE
jgi:hypothetical protein